MSDETSPAPQWPEWYNEYKELVPESDMRFKYVGNRYVAIVNFVYTVGIISGERIHETIGYDDRWCYENMALAHKAFEEWDGAVGTEPQGWHRHPNTGRRRPDGTPESEYINP